MYTEDDEKVVIKDDDSNEDYSDFYTSFSVDKNSNKKKKKTKKKISEPKQEFKLKDEEDYSEFYGTTDDEVPNDTSEKGKKTIRMLIVGGILLTQAIIIIIIILGTKSSKDPDILLINDNFKINVGESEIISYKIINTNDEVKATFKSSDTNVATVDENGKITGVDDGETDVVVGYTISGKNKEKKCHVTVIGDGKVDKPKTPAPTQSPTSTPKDDKKLTLNLKLENGKDNVWTNKDVTIRIDANSGSGIKSLQYTFNCEGSKCDYKDVKDNKIFVTNPGTTKVLVVAKDKNNQQEEKLVTIKIDKVPPKISFTNPGNITANNETTVCATCKDELSGCKQPKVCKKYTSSQKKQRIIVEDEAGNQVSSSEFNVTINKDGPICTLAISSDGKVTATVNTDASYYGFNESYSGTNELSKYIDINASKKGESGAKVVNYYVKNKNGTGGKCVITVIKECNCTDPNSTSENCPVTCTYSSR